MELGPIFRALLYNRGRFLLIALEIALTLAIVANCLHLIRYRYNLIERPTGLDEANLLTVTAAPFGSRFSEPGYVEGLIERDMERLRSLPGVKAATAIHAFPLSGGGSSTGRMAEGSTLDTISSPYFYVGTQAVATLGVEIVAGRDFVAADYPPAGLDDVALEAHQDNANIIVTQALADKLFPDGDALGKVITTGDEGNVRNTIVGIMRRMHGSWPLSQVVEDVMLIPLVPGDARQLRYLVRSEPNALATVQPAVDAALLELEPERILRLEAMTDTKAGTYSFTTAMMRSLAAVAALLVLVTALGIVGLTAFSVNERTRQIGTRRALGASRWAILRYFLIENWMLSSIGLLAGAICAYALDLSLRASTGAPPLELSILLAGMLLLWLSGLGAALVPALRSTRVPPVIATRTV